MLHHLRRVRVGVRVGVRVRVRVRVGVRVRVRVSTCGLERNSRVSRILLLGRVRVGLG